MRCQVTFLHNSGLPKDSITNSFALTTKGGSTEDSASSAFTVELDAFYSAIGSWLSDEYAWDVGTAEYISMETDRPRLPFKTQTISATGVSGTNIRMPAELALCCSLEGERTSGVNMRRRRGRFYVGPLNVETSGNQSRPSSALVAALSSALDGLITASLSDYELCIYSRYTHYKVPVGSNITDKDENGDPLYDEDPDFLAGSYTPVVRAWVDDAWDIQRRRGLSPSTRTIVEV